MKGIIQTRTTSIRPRKGSLFVHNLDYGDVRIRNGVYIPNDDMKQAGIRPRWAQILFVADDLKRDFAPGQWILLDHGNWSRGFDIELQGEITRVWFVEPKSVKRGGLLISDEMPDDLK